MESGIKPMEIEGSFWFHKDDHKFLGGDRINLLEKIEECGSITKAAKVVGISYKTAWDTVNLMNNLSDKPLVERMTGGKGGGGTYLTPEGKDVIRRFRIIQEEHRKYLVNLSERVGDVDTLYKFLRRIAMKVSARNVFSGSVTDIKKGAVNTEVTLTLKGGTAIAAIVTNGSIDNLGLKVGSDAYAIIKASAIIIGSDLHDAKLSARNIMCGAISRIIEGPVSTDVEVDIGGGNTVSAVITHESGIKLGLKEGGHACAIFKASSVILGVS
jgi:molybdate transport system regulatory protein